MILFFPFCGQLFHSKHLCFWTSRKPVFERDLYLTATILHQSFSPVASIAESKVAYILFSLYATSSICKHCGFEKITDWDVETAQSQSHSIK